MGGLPLQASRCPVSNVSVYAFSQSPVSNVSFYAFSQKNKGWIETSQFILKKYIYIAFEQCIYILKAVNSQLYTLKGLSRRTLGSHEETCAQSWFLSHIPTKRSQGPLG